MRRLQRYLRATSVRRKRTPEDKTSLGRAVNPLITLLNDPPVVSGQHVPVVPRHRHIDRRLKTLFPCSERVGHEFGRRAALNERGGVGKDIINEGGRTKIELHRHVGAAGNR